MSTLIERLDTQIAAARKDLDKATGKRDDAIAQLIRSAERIKQAQRALGRLERRKAEARKASRAERRAAVGSQAEPIAPL